MYNKKSYLIALCMILTCWLMTPIQAQGAGFEITDLHSDGTNKSYAVAINNLGNVIVRNIFTEDEQNKATECIWSPECGLLPLSVTPSYHWPKINDLNQISGVHWETSTYSKGVYLFNANGGFKNLNSPNGWEIHPFASNENTSGKDHHELSVIDFNNRGQILVSNRCCLQSKPFQSPKFAICTQSSCENINTEILTKAYALNNRGWVLGESLVSTPLGDIPTLVIWQSENGTVQKITRNEGLIIKDFNDQGQFVGLEKNSSTGQQQGFLCSADGDFTYFDNFLPEVINNKGQMIGVMQVGNHTTVPAFYRDGEVINANTYLNLPNADSPRQAVQMLCDINDDGCIVGSGISLFDQEPHAMLLTPFDDAKD